MKLLLLIAALMFAASAISDNEWAEYKEKYKKVYTSLQEDMRRLNQYLNTKKIIEEHNIRFKKGETSYRMNLNQFSDWFSEEKEHLLGYKPGSTNSQGKPFKLLPGTSVPDSVNWVTLGAVTSVKNQLRCGSCYAFSAAGSLEGLMFITNNTITDLSVQQLVDCSSNYGCQGGWPQNCFEYVKEKNGIFTDESYPYVGEYEKCRHDGKVAATCTGYKVLNDEKELTGAVGTVGPVSIIMDVGNDFFNYQGGVYDGDCSNAPNHAMLAVGYDKDKETEKDYWLIKNSWGETWGENGFVRVIRNVKKCSIGAQASYPVYSTTFK